MTKERVKEICDEQVEMLVTESKKDINLDEKIRLSNLICTLAGLFVNED